MVRIPPTVSRFRNFSSTKQTRANVTALHRKCERYTPKTQRKQGWTPRGHQDDELDELDNVDELYGLLEDEDGDDDDNDNDDNDQQQVCPRRHACCSQRTENASVLLAATGSHSPALKRTDRAGCSQLGGSTARAWTSSTS